MDFRRLAKALPATESPNATTPVDLAHLPSNILEALIPGYGLISRYAETTLGLDISLFVTIGLIILAASRAGQYLATQSEKLLRSLFLSSIYIEESDDLFDMVMGWLAEQQSYSAKRSVRAKTQTGSRIEGEFDANPQDALDENGLFDNNKWNARTAPRFEPYYGRHWIWHNNTLFFFRRSQKTSASQRVQVTFSSTPDDELLQLDCVGRSTEPLRELLRAIKISTLKNGRNTTIIRHPTPKDRARFGGAWSKTTGRPSRPMETVILDTEQKTGIIKDMNEYLNPSSPKWYAKRGIPYRRGYLFYGAPGTGKTSLSFALAGLFGLEIYTISLQEPTLTEGDLMQLFNGLPRRCVVLLEDVDAAGLTRDGDDDDEKKKKTRSKDENDEKDGKDGQRAEKAKKDDDFTLKDLARELKAIGTANATKGNRGGRGNQPQTSPTGVSLSGLLNAIDGVSSQEGRILILTTNHPEKLDPALVRPGRIDRKVSFRLAMKDQITELFIRMYASSDQLPDIEPNFGALINGFTKQANGKPTTATNGHGSKHSTKPHQLLSDAELEALALEFAGHIPDDTLTPAELQGFLLLHKREPRVAVEQAGQWVKDLLEEKEKLAREKEENENTDEE